MTRHPLLATNIEFLTVFIFLEPSSNKFQWMNFAEFEHMLQEMHCCLGKGNLHVFTLLNNLFKHAVNFDCMPRMCQLPTSCGQSRQHSLWRRNSLFWLCPPHPLPLTHLLIMAPFTSVSVLSYLCWPATHILCSEGCWKTSGQVTPSTTPTLSIPWPKVLFARAPPSFKTDLASHSLKVLFPVIDKVLIDSAE